jgi:hypothetical protein
MKNIKKGDRHTYVDHPLFFDLSISMNVREDSTVGSSGHIRSGKKACTARTSQPGEVRPEP